MNVADIKFKREKGEYNNTLHVFEGTKYLPKLYVTGGSGYYDAYDYETGRILNRGRYSWFHTLKAAKAWIASYDEIHENTLRVMKEEEEARIAEWEARKAKEERLGFEFLALGDGYKPSAGHIVAIRKPNLNKNSTIGEYVSEIGDYHEVNASIVKVIKLTATEYVEFANNLLDSHAAIEYKRDTTTFNGKEVVGIVGGNYSPEFANDDRDFYKLSESERELYYATAVDLVHAIVADGFPTIYVNTEGFDYARYIGFDLPTVAKIEALTK